MTPTRKPYGMACLLGGGIELIFAHPAKFLQGAMQPQQLLWEAKHRAPLEPAHRGRIERPRRDCGDILNNDCATGLKAEASAHRMLPCRNELAWSFVCQERSFCSVRCILRCIGVCRTPCFCPTKGT
jgi:hypothetical protein